MLLLLEATACGKKEHISPACNGRYLSKPCLHDRISPAEESLGCHKFLKRADFKSDLPFLEADKENKSVCCRVNNPFPKRMQGFPLLSFILQSGRNDAGESFR